MVAARGLFVEVGNVDVSLEAVAERAGVAKATLLHHFGSRGGLLEAVANGLAAAAWARLDGDHDSAATMARALVELCRSPEARVYVRALDVLAGDPSTNREAEDVAHLTRTLAALTIGSAAPPPLVAAALHSLARRVALGQADDDAIEAVLGALHSPGHLSTNGR